MDESRSPLDSLYEHDRCVLLTELLRAHPELLPEAETIATTLLIADDRQIEKDVADKLRSLRVSALADRIGHQQDEKRAAAGLLAEVIQPYLDDIVLRASIGARTAAAM